MPQKTSKNTNDVWTRLAEAAKTEPPRPAGDGWVTAKDLAELWGLSREGARGRLETLINKGLVEVVFWKSRKFFRPKK